jgi:hypothetical protein
MADSPAAIAAAARGEHLDVPDGDHRARLPDRVRDQERGELPVAVADRRHADRRRLRRPFSRTVWRLYGGAKGLVMWYYYLRRPADRRAWQPQLLAAEVHLPGPETTVFGC